MLNQAVNISDRPDIQRHISGVNRVRRSRSTELLSCFNILVLIRLLDDPRLVDLLLRQLLADLVLDQIVQILHCERVDFIRDQRPHGVDEDVVLKTLEGAAADGSVNDRRPVGIDPALHHGHQSVFNALFGGVRQRDVVLGKRFRDLFVEGGDLLLETLLRLSDDLILVAVGIGVLFGDLFEAPVVSVLNRVGDVETQIVLITLVLVLQQTVAVERRLHDELIVVGVSVGLRCNVRVVRVIKVDLQVDIELELVGVGGALRLHLLVDLLGDGSAKLLGDLGLAALEGGVAVADIDGGVGLTVEHDFHIAADIVALAVVEVRPQVLAFLLEKVDDLRLDRLQGLAGEIDAGLVLDGVLNAGQETVDLRGSGRARFAGDDRVGDLVRLLDGGDDLAVIHVQSDVPDDLALSLGVTGEVRRHVPDIDHAVDNVLDLLELRVRQVVVGAVVRFNGADNGALHVAESVVGLLDGLENGIADQVIGNDHGSLRLPDREQGDVRRHVNACAGDHGAARARRPALELLTLRSSEGALGQRVVAADDGDIRHRAGAAVRVKAHGVGGHRGIHRGIHGGIHGRIHARGVIRLRALHEVRHTVDHRCHLRTGGQFVGTERAILKAVDQAVTLALLDRGERIRGDRVLIDHDGDGAGLGQSHLPCLLIEGEVTLDHGAHLRTGDGIVRGKLAVAHTIHDPVGGRPVDGIGVPLAGSHIGECALAAITLCTVETEQDRDEHRTGHVVRGGEGLVRDAVEVTLRRHIVYELVVPVGSADVREIVSFFRQRCGHQGKDDAQCQQSTQDTLLFHLLNHSFFLLMIFEYRKRVSAFPPQALLAASKTCPCPGVRIGARTDSNTVYIKSIRYFLFLQAVLAFFSISFQGSYIRKLNAANCSDKSHVRPPYPSSKQENAG